MPTISVFRNATSNESLISSPEQVIQSIIDGTFQEYITYLRSLTKADYDAEKKSLTAATWSGTFKEGTRSKSTMTSYSNLVVLDIDHLEDATLLNLKEQLKAEPFVRYAFISPSGKGLKIVVQVNTGQEHHRAAFLHLQKYFEEKYFIQIDKSGKDECRLCYLSHDPQAIINNQSSVFEVDVRYGDIIVEHQNSFSGSSVDSVETIFKVCVKWIERNYQFVEGSRNVFIHSLACALNRCGVSQENAIIFICQNYSSLGQEEIVKAIKSAYFHNQSQYNTVKIKDIGNSTFEAPPHIPMSDDAVIDDIMKITSGLYWYKVPNDAILSIVSKVCRFYEGKGYLDFSVHDIKSIMNMAVIKLQESMATQAAQYTLSYQSVDSMVKEMLDFDLSSGIKTFIKPIDDITSGLIQGNFYGLIGFGETYKSMLAQHITFHNAVNGVPVLFLNGEMAKIQFIERLARQVFDINFRQQINQGILKKENIDAFVLELMKFTQNNIFVYSGTGFSKKSILSTIDHILATTGKKVKLVIMDGLSQMDQVNKEEAQANIYNSGVCKEIVKEANGGEGVTMLSLIHCSGPENKLVRNTGSIVRGGSKMIAMM